MGDCAHSGPQFHTPVVSQFLTLRLEVKATLPLLHKERTQAALGSQAPEKSLFWGLVSRSAIDRFQLQVFRAPRAAQGQPSLNPEQADKGSHLVARPQCANRNRLEIRLSSSSIQPACAEHPLHTRYYFRHRGSAETKTRQSLSTGYSLVEGQYGFICLE